MLGIIGAMPEEVAELIEGMKEERTETKAGMLFHTGTLEGEPAVIVKSGVGKVNAGICAQILVDDFHVTGLINTGIAGSPPAIHLFPTGSKKNGSGRRSGLPVPRWRARRLPRRRG